jgi:hypothetical protein
MEDEHRSAGRPTAPARDRAGQAQEMTGRRVFRSPFAVLIWWIWAVFAAANVVDLAVQGRDRFSLLAGIGLVLVTGLLYDGAWRPRIITDDEGLTISNPLRDHKVSWATVGLIEAAELVRVRCEWPLGGDERSRAAQEAGPPGKAGPSGKAGAATGKRVIYAWAVHSARRKERIRELRKEARGSLPGSFGRSGGYTSPQGTSTVAIDANQVAAELSEMTQRRRGPSSEPAVAVAPVSRWNWPAIAAIVVPAVALLVVALL